MLTTTYVRTLVSAACDVTMTSSQPACTRLVNLCGHWRPLLNCVCPRLVHLDQPGSGLYLVCRYGRAPYPACLSFEGITQVPHIQESQHTPARNIMIRVDLLCCVVTRTCAVSFVVGLYIHILRPWWTRLQHLRSALLCACHSSPPCTCRARFHV